MRWESITFDPRNNNFMRVELAGAKDGTEVIMGIAEISAYIDKVIDENSEALRNKLVPMALVLGAHPSSFIRGWLLKKLQDDTGYSVSTEVEFLSVDEQKAFGRFQVERAKKYDTEMLENRYGELEKLLDNMEESDDNEEER